MVVICSYFLCLINKYYYILVFFSAIYLENLRTMLCRVACSVETSLYYFYYFIFNEYRQCLRIYGMYSCYTHVDIRPYIRAYNNNTINIAPCIATEPFHYNLHLLRILLKGTYTVLIY